MELFHEYKNKCMYALTVLVERLSNVEEMSFDEFENEYYRLADDDKRLTELFFYNVLDNEKIKLFKFNNGKIYIYSDLLSNCKADITNIPLNTEKMWLNTALNDSFTDLFYDSSEKERFNDKLAEYMNYSEFIDNNWKNNKNINEMVIANFRILLDAINQSKKISYVLNGNKFTGTPRKLEYDERNSVLYLIISSENRTAKTSLSKLTDIIILDETADISFDIAEAMNDKKKRTPIEFIVTDYKGHNAIERALFAFSVYDHTVEMIDEKTAKFIISYYAMDLDIIIKEILTFGADIQVKSPEIVIRKISEILQKL